MPTSDTTNRRDLRRPISRNLRCATQPCPEFAHWEFSSRKEYDDHVRRVREWSCLKHEHPEKVLSPARLRIEWLSEPCEPSAKYPTIPRTTLFWGNTGFLHGDGYYAYADDFPVGTRIRVTAEVILPPLAPQTTTDGQPEPAGGNSGVPKGRE